MRFDRWKITGYDRPTAVEFTKQGYNPLVALSLVSRGFGTVEEAERFLDCSNDVLPDPFLLKDMDAAVARIRRAIDTGETVCVYGDYDVDGITSSCAVATYLRSRGVPCSIYIPGRLDEGYGVNNQALYALADKGVTLIITVDCGITSIDEAEYARSLGIDMIVTDHHECKSVLPDALAVVDPKRKDCPYPNKSLAGVGVAFKLISALEGPEATDDIFEEYGDLFALGTVADVVPVVGENRVIVSRGLEKINRCTRPGLRALLNEACGREHDVTSTTISFVIAPRLNAAGRMGCTDVAVDLLMTEDEMTAASLATRLCLLNDERRQLVNSIYEEALLMYEEDTIETPVILASHGWFQGVMGIVAARMSELYYLPAIMICIGDDGIGRGSCRSFHEFSLYRALEACSDLLESFGGHEMAAGLMIKEENIPEFKRRMHEYYAQQVKLPQVPTLFVDFEVIKPQLLSLENISALKVLEPYGSGHKAPLLCLRGALLNSIAPVGRGRHTKLRVSKNGSVFDCIFFSHTAEELGLSPGCRVDLAFEPQINEFRGRKSVQLMLLDICRRAVIAE